MRIEARAEANLVEAFDFRLKIVRDRVKDVITIIRWKLSSVIRTETFEPLTPEHIGLISRS